MTAPDTFLIEIDIYVLSALKSSGRPGVAPFLLSHGAIVVVIPTSRIGRSEATPSSKPSLMDSMIQNALHRRRRRRRFRCRQRTFRQLCSPSSPFLQISNLSRRSLICNANKQPPLAAMFGFGFGRRDLARRAPGTKNTHRYRHRGQKSADLDLHGVPPLPLLLPLGPDAP